MNPMRTFAAVAMAALLLSASIAQADVKTQEKTRVQFGGMMGKIVNLFGGSAARDGVVSTVAVQGARKMTVNNQTGQIIDLAEEKVYDLDIRRKTYTVTTFDELRRRMREAEERARQEAAAAEPEPQTTDEPADRPEFEVDFELQKVSTDVAAADVAVPAGFRQN